MTNGKDLEIDIPPAGPWRHGRRRFLTLFAASLGAGVVVARTSKATEVDSGNGEYDQPALRRRASALSKAHGLEPAAAVIETQCYDVIFRFVRSLELRDTPAQVIDAFAQDLYSIFPGGGALAASVLAAMRFDWTIQDGAINASDEVDAHFRSLDIPHGNLVVRDLAQDDGSALHYEPDLIEAWNTGKANDREPALFAAYQAGWEAIRYPPPTFETKMGTGPTALVYRLKALASTSCAFSLSQDLLRRQNPYEPLIRLARTGLIVTGRKDSTLFAIDFRSLAA